MSHFPFHSTWDLTLQFLVFDFATAMNYKNLNTTNIYLVYEFIDRESQHVVYKPNRVKHFFSFCKIYTIFIKYNLKKN